MALVAPPVKSKKEERADNVIKGNWKWTNMTPTVSCVADAYRLGGVGLGSGMTGKPGLFIVKIYYQLFGKPEYQAII